MKRMPYLDQPGFTNAAGQPYTSLQLAICAVLVALCFAIICWIALVAGLWLTIKPVVRFITERTLNAMAYVKRHWHRS